MTIPNKQCELSFSTKRKCISGEQRLTTSPEQRCCSMQLLARATSNTTRQWTVEQPSAHQWAGALTGTVFLAALPGAMGQSPDDQHTEYAVAAMITTMCVVLAAALLWNLTKFSQQMTVSTNSTPDVKNRGDRMYDRFGGQEEPLVARRFGVGDSGPDPFENQPPLRFGASARCIRKRATAAPPPGKPVSRSCAWWARPVRGCPPAKPWCVGKWATDAAKSQPSVRRRIQGLVW